MIARDSLDTVPIKALVDSVPIDKQLLHDHRLLTTNATERSGSALVQQKPQINPSTVRLLLQILAILKGLCLPVSDILGGSLVLEAPSSYHRRLVALRYIDRVLRVGNLDHRKASDFVMIPRTVCGLGHPRSPKTQAG